jgi:S-formylglutathione hydrolase FrmB
MIKKTLIFVSRLLVVGMFLISSKIIAGDVTIIDSRHYSNVFGEIRNFRVFLPPGYYENPGKRYPVIYFYHGWSQRYFGSGPDPYNSYEKGNDNNGDNISNFVAGHEVIVVKTDGYNRSPGEDYYLRPYNIGPVETFRQYPIYFPELVSYIDASYRTIADRNHRAISGLSMGGFMSFWVGGKYPDLISAIGNFCGSPEFVVGPKDFPAEYRHIDMYKNYEGINVRLNYGNEDFIRFYHRDMNKIWTMVMDNYEFKIYPAAHSTCGMGEMFGFLMKSFENPPEKPLKWSHIDVYPEFSVWDYEVASDRDLSGFTILENVNIRGFRCSVRDHLPDGELFPFVSLSVITPPLYEVNTSYLINDFDLRNLKAIRYELKSDEKGRLKIAFNGSTHEIGINKAEDIPNISLISYTIDQMSVAECNKDVAVKLTLLNKGNKIGEEIKAVLSSTRNSASVLNDAADFGTIEVNKTSQSKSTMVFNVHSDSIEIEKFKLTITDRFKNEWVEFLEIPLVKKDLPELKEFEIADGRVVTVAKEGIKEETILLGRGNGDGKANPGESIVILAKENGKLWRTCLAGHNKYINANGINTRVSDNWSSYDNVGGSAKYSVSLISSDCPDNQVINFIAEYWLPDKPDHIIKKARVDLKVTGKDVTSPDLQWLRITGDNVIQAKIIDGSAIRNIKAKLILRTKPDSYLEFDLKDDGRNGDRAENDNLFSFKVPEQKFGLYNVEVIATDTFGNQMTKPAPGIFVLH